MTQRVPLLPLLSGSLMLLMGSGGIPAVRAETAPSAEQQALLERLRERQAQEHERWRRFGDVEVDWTSWKPFDSHPYIWVTPWRRAVTRPTAIGGLSWPSTPESNPKSNVPDRALAVNCRDLTLNRKRAGSNWGDWRVPGAGTPAEQLLLDACSSLSS
ncbi:hypothetical protein [Vulcanococcus sp. DEBay_Sum22DG08_74]|uniref:hypothetical protein n=1 Tax=Vulcanococcus sp. DEBay_Sum22DG08_74 TaxID=2806299 RepID=UPI0025DC08C2|nr:hypothetical protein [Vulcanococcus sp. DEBay_Sum22DG08_74]